jgi:hypothetical protein
MRRLLTVRAAHSKSRKLFPGAVVAFLLLASFAAANTGTAAAAVASSPTGALAGIWNRLNPQQSQSNPAPENEQLACNRRADVDGGAWLCRYHKIPRPTLNFAWNNTTGRFAGSDVTATWACPAWFPTTICGNVVQVVEGPFVFDLASGGQFAVLQDLVVTQVGGEQRLFDYWVNMFVCPWFRSFDEALAANPFPLPFNGVNGPAGDCIAAP